MRCVPILMVCCLMAFGISPAGADEPDPWNEPFWVLLHEPAAIAELKLDAAQQTAFHEMRDELDLRFIPLRNKSRQEALTGAGEIIAEARRKLKDLLTPEQQQRFGQLVLQRLGHDALLRPEVADRLEYSESQRDRIAGINKQTQEAIAALQKRLREGGDRDQINREQQDLLARQGAKLVKLLKPSQQSTFKQMLGRRLDGAKLGRPHFRAPEFVDTGEWINSSPLTLEELRGKVVVVHFYAFGCINCIRNYPWYRQWSERFADKDVVIVGIHTPETSAEQESAAVRRKAAEEKFDFPILIDGEKSNWNAWGNAMWPCVYLIDKQGHFREFWAGELNWQGADGEQYMRQKIEALLAEPGA